MTYPQAQPATYLTSKYIMCVRKSYNFPSLILFLSNVNKKMLVESQSHNLSKYHALSLSNLALRSCSPCSGIYQQFEICFKYTFTHAHTRELCVLEWDKAFFFKQSQNLNNLTIDSIKYRALCEKWSVWKLSKE